MQFTTDWNSIQTGFRTNLTRIMCCIQRIRILCCNFRKPDFVKLKLNKQNLSCQTQRQAQAFPLSIKWNCTCGIDVTNDRRYTKIEAKMFKLKKIDAPFAINTSPMKKRNCYTFKNLFRTIVRNPQQVYFESRGKCVKQLLRYNGYPNKVNKSLVFFFYRCFTSVSFHPCNARNI